VHESENLAHLHMKIRSCDKLLEGMEDVLGGFRADLGKVSEEIKGLQHRAADLSVKSSNRRDVNVRLSGVVDSVAVSPILVHTITEAEVNEAYIEHLLQLRKKLNSADSALSEPLLVAGGMTVRPVLENLRIKAVEKARAFLLQKIYSLARPKTNFQILQQSVLLKFKCLREFLRDNHPEAHEQVRPTNRLPYRAVVVPVPC